MSKRRESRKRAYRYIVEQATKLNRDLGHESDKTIADIDYISLYDLEELKEGLSDPPQELVVKLKKIFRHVASEAKIDQYLVRPFLPKK